MDCSLPSPGISSSPARYSGMPAPPATEGDPDERRVHAEVAGQALGHAADHPAGVGPAQRGAVSIVDDGFWVHCAGVHGSSLAGRAGLAHREDPRPAPQPARQGFRDVPDTGLGSLRVSAPN